MTRLWPRAMLTAFCAIALGLSLGGCSISYKLDSMFGDKEDAKPASTGSVAGTSAQAAVASKGGPPAHGVPNERDLAYVKAAVSVLLVREGADTSLPWENPQTGARGTVTPVAAAYTREGFTCRDFRASYLRDGSEAWLQGEACRLHKGKWEVRSMRPLLPS